MTRTLKLLFVVWLIFTAATLVCPPWMTVDTAGESQPRGVGWHPIWSPPEPDEQTHLTRVHWRDLLIVWAPTTIAAVVIVFFIARLRADSGRLC